MDFNSKKFRIDRKGYLDSNLFCMVVICIIKRSLNDRFVRKRGVVIKMNEDEKLVDEMNGWIAEQEDTIEPKKDNKIKKWLKRNMSREREPNIDKLRYHRPRKSQA